MDGLKIDFFWDKWKSFLPKNSQFYIGDRGYFNMPMKLCIQKSRKYSVVITHSSGLHFIDSNQLSQCDFLVIVSGFMKFDNIDFIEKMLVRIEKKDVLVLEQFYRRSMRFEKMDFKIPENINWDRLYSDLILLSTNEFPISLLYKIPKILIIHGAKDAIIPLKVAEKLTEELPCSEFFSLKGAGHIFSSKYIMQCCKKICKCITFKQQVALNFSSKAYAYHSYADIQQFSADVLVQSLKHMKLPKGPVIEIGCGTGFVTKAIIDVIGSRLFVVTDIASEMVDFCKKRFEFLKNNMAFEVKDGEIIDAVDKYALIVSGMAFQWFNNIYSSIEKLFYALKEGGYLLFSLLEDKSFKEWKEMCVKADCPFTGNSLPRFKDIEQLLCRLDPNAEVFEKSYSKIYKDPLHFFKHFKEIGMHASRTSKIFSGYSLMSLCKQWKKDFPENCEVSYNIVYGKIMRKK